MILTSRHHPHFFVILIQNKNFLRFSKSRKGLIFEEKRQFLRKFRIDNEISKIHVWQIKFFILSGRSNSCFDHLQITKKVSR